MGEQAEMMLDGTLCSVCGEYLGGDEGYPVECVGCQLAGPPPMKTQAELDAYSRKVSEAKKAKRRAKRKMQRARKTARLGAMRDCTEAVAAMKRSLPTKSALQDSLQFIDDHRRDLERLAGMRD